MTIRKKRIRNLKSNMPTARRGDRLVFGVTDIDRFAERLSEIGCSHDLIVGESLLPASLGPVTDFNANGKYIKHKDQPKETAYRQVEWHWKEFRGRYDRVDRSKIVDVPYKRYPRTFVLPPGIELTVAADTSGNKLIVGPAVVYSVEQDESNLHIANMFLELFGECDVRRDNLDEIIQGNVKRLNWKILPEGRLPWDRLRGQVAPIVNRQAPGNRFVIEHRLETINSYEPEFVAIGHAGFQGYVIFGFPDSDLYVLESMMFDNATYVFENDWETLSQKTKAEILDNNLQKDRLIHRKGWENRVGEVMSSAGRPTG